MKRFFFILACFVTLHASGLDWPQFRGPAGQGHAPHARNLPTTWSNSENVIWRIKVPGKGWSSPILVNNRIYLTSASELGVRGHSLRVICVDFETGATLWNRETFKHGAMKIHHKNSHASPTPILLDDRIFAHFGTNGTICLNLDGDVIWRTQKLKYNPVHGSGGSPAIVDGNLIVSCDGGDQQFVVALDQKTGKIKWKTPRPRNDGKRFAFSTPLLIESGGQRQLISVGAGHAVSYDPVTGKEIWRVFHGGYSVVPRPVYGNGLVFISSSFDRPVIMAIRPDGRGDVSDTHVAWTSNRGAPHSPSLLLIGDELYSVSDRGVASCYDSVSGEVHWTKRIGGNFSASPVFADGKIFLQSETGDTTVIAPGTTFNQSARNSIDEPTLASFAIGESSIILRSESHLYRIERSQSN